MYQYYAVLSRHLLLNRVLLGKFHKTKKSVKFAHPPPGYNSVLAEATPDVLRYQEFVIYRGEQVSPFDAKILLTKFKNVLLGGNVVNYSRKLFTRRKGCFPFWNVCRARRNLHYGAITETLFGFIAHQFR